MLRLIFLLSVFSDSMLQASSAYENNPFRIDFPVKKILQIGGFPNPSGKEVRYVDVPYSFKIFMMLEVQKLGFNQVMWLDSSAIPLKDLTPLFDHVARNGALIQGGPINADQWRYILSVSRKVLIDQLGIDVMKINSSAGFIFGLKMDSRKTQEMIADYYDMVELGTPFLSCFPEGTVWSCLIAKTNSDDFYSLDLIGASVNPWKLHSFPHLFDGSNLKGTAGINAVRDLGSFFYLSYER